MIEPIDATGDSTGAERGLRNGDALLQGILAGTAWSTADPAEKIAGLILELGRVLADGNRCRTAHRREVELVATREIGRAILRFNAGYASWTLERQAAATPQN